MKPWPVLLAVPLVALVGRSLGSGQREVSASYDRGALIGRYERRVTQLQVEAETMPKSWQAAFDLAWALCKLREQYCLEATRSATARSGPNDAPYAELALAAERAERLARTPEEQALTRRLRSRIGVSEQPGRP